MIKIFLKTSRYLFCKPRSSVSRASTGCPKSNKTASIDLIYNLGDESENSRRINHFENLKRPLEIFYFAENARFFDRVLCAYLALKIGDNLI